MRVQDAAPDFGPVRVGVNEARHDRFAAHIEHFGARRRAAFRADAFDAVILDDDVGVLQNFVAPHCYNCGASKNDRAFGRFSRDFQIDGDLLNVLFLFLQFLFFFFLVLLLILLLVFLHICRL